MTLGTFFNFFLALVVVLGLIGVLAWAGVRIAIAVTVFVAIAAIGGAFVSPLAVLAPLAALLCGLAFAAPLRQCTRPLFRAGAPSARASRLPAREKRPLRQCGRF